MGEAIETGTYHCLFDVDLVGLCVLGGDGAAGRLVADQRALGKTRRASAWAEG